MENEECQNVGSRNEESAPGRETTNSSTTRERAPSIEIENSSDRHVQTQSTAQNDVAIDMSASNEETATTNKVPPASDTQPPPYSECMRNNLDYIRPPPDERDPNQKSGPKIILIRCLMIALIMVGVFIFLFLTHELCKYDSLLYYGVMFLIGLFIGGVAGTEQKV